VGAGRVARAHAFGNGLASSRWAAGPPGGPSGGERRRRRGRGHADRRGGVSAGPRRRGPEGSGVRLRWHAQPGARPWSPRRTQVKRCARRSSFARSQRWRKRCSSAATGLGRRPGY
jgi:hypothetical protein